MTGTGTQTDPYIVSEYAEFITAITTSDVYVKCADNTVWDMNEIDPTGEKYHNSNKSFNCTELDGNGAIINNLYSTISGGNTLFLVDNAVIKNLKFYNMNLTNGAAFFKVSSYYAQVSNCQFTGLLGEHAVLFWSSGSQYNPISVSESLISVELYGASKIVNGVYSFDNNLIEVSFISDNYTYSQVSFRYLQSCWFKGIFPFGRLTSGVNVSSSGGNYNVIDAEIRSEQLSLSLNGTYVINTDKYNYDLPLTTYNNAILATEEQMRDPAYLRSKGFPVPNSKG